MILTSKFYEVQKYLSVTNHVYTANPVVISKKVWDKLSPADQKIIQEAAVEAGAFERKISREAAIERAQGARSQGHADQRRARATLTGCRELTRPVAEKFEASYDQAVVKVYREEIAKASRHGALKPAQAVRAASAAVQRCVEHGGW